MTDITVPTLAAEDELHYPLDADINAIVEPILQRGMQSPVISPVDAASLFAQIPPEPPARGQPLNAVLSEIDRVVVHHSRRNAHPGFFGYIAGPGLPTDPLSHAITAALNQNLIGYPGSPGASVLEQRVIGWMRQLSGLPDTADGVITSGGSLANLSALAVALYSTLGDACIRTGLATSSDGIPVILATRSAHFSIQRAAVLLGIGSERVLSVTSDSDHRMQPAALQRTLDRCRLQGYRPVCVVANAGSTIAGVIDPLEAIAKVCHANQVWLHVDAAYGGAGLLSERLRPGFAGIEHADSISMDLHKWFYLAFDGSVLLFRQPDLAREVFYSHSDYVQFAKGGPPEEHMFFHLSPELSRRFRALPAYIAFRYYGMEKLGRNIFHNHECAVYLSKLVQANPDLELVTKAELSICNFRFRPETLKTDAHKVDQLNMRIRERIQEQGEFLLSATHFDGRPVLRVCIVSHTTRATHIEQLCDTVCSVGRSLINNEAE